MKLIAAILGLLIVVFTVPYFIFACNTDSKEYFEIKGQEIQLVKISGVKYFSDSTVVYK